MASTPEASSAYQQEYTDFIAKLTAYHQKRGTNLDIEPRVGTKYIDLLQLFKTVVERGGYDKVSDEKLAWRKLGQDFNLGTANLPALAFSLKSTYYKNLAAYEISTIHGKEPPPKEILEDVTAKGGGLLERTVENYRPSSRRETNALGLDGSEASGDDGTPVRDTVGSEDTPGSGGRATRGLRQAPPQRVLFQPDTQPSRQSRQNLLPTTSAPLTPRGASHSYNPSTNPDMFSQAVSNYEPRPQMPLTLRPVITPANNPVEFKKLRMLKEQLANPALRPVSQPRIMLPGTGFDGPNIYVRCLLALKSGVPAEQDYALHHLVKISMERGDKYRFESFAGLAEALVEKVLEVSSLFYDVAWEVVYPDDGRPRSLNTLDGLEGTPDILERISRLTQKDVDDNVQPEHFTDRLLQVIEAALTLRNMVMLEDNAHYVSEIRPLRDMLSIVLNLPNLEVLVELKHYALDIVEQITKYLHFDARDPLYISLVAQLDSSDRGAVLTSLRAISRISLNLEDTNRLQGIPTKTLQNILDWVMLEDEELVNSCLDFLYQYSAVVSNVNNMINEVDLGGLVSQLTRLLSHGARESDREYVIKPQIRHLPPADIPNVPEDLLSTLLTMDEPDRSSKWLRCLFEEDKDESITQIALWQAYQSRFAPAVEKLGRPLLPAADFIKNVSTTFAEKAAAQVQSGPVQKFIIKGIRIRDVPVDLSGRPYTKCRWVSDIDTPSGRAMLECHDFFMTPENMYNHILEKHVKVPKTQDGKFINQETNYQCLWAGCTKYLSPHPLKTSQFASHVKIHLPQTTPSTDALSVKALKPSWIEPPVLQKFTFQQTAMDERGDAAGIPLTAVLVLRNLARNLPKTEAEETVLKEGGVSYIVKLFKPVEPRLWHTFAYNKGVVSLSLFCSFSFRTGHVLI
jgi:chromatin structure-remodeling complex subunit RSC9